MRNSNQPREPKGIRTGGRWQPRTRPEGSVTLVVNDKQRVDDEWEGWDEREAAVAERIASYHPDCARRWASDSLRDARWEHERATKFATAQDLLGEVTARELREQALARLAAAEHHAGLGRTMTLRVATSASKEQMTSLAGGNAGWCIAPDLVSFEQVGEDEWRLSGPEWYVRGHVRQALERRDVNYEHGHPDGRRTVPAPGQHEVGRQ